MRTGLEVGMAFVGSKSSEKVFRSKKVNVCVCVCVCVCMFMRFHL